MNTIQAIGFMIFVAAVVVAAFTSNLIISKKEIELAEMWSRSKGQLPATITDEARHAYLNVRIAFATRCLAAVGILIFLFGIFF